MNRPGFIVYALPRSRTFWLARYLSYGGWHCGHDELRHARSLDDVKAWFSQPVTGTVETAAGPWWRLVRMMAPDIRTVVIRRDPEAALESLASTGIRFDGALLRKTISALDRKLDQIEARVPGVLSVRYEDLRSEDACARVFEFCLPFGHDRRWWEGLQKINLQCDLPALLRYFDAYSPQLEKLGRTAAQVVRRSMAKAPAMAPDSVTFQVERFDDWFRDAAPLFREHMIVTGQDVEDYNRKNLPVLRAIDGLGFMQIMTARSNGRMFGYLMTVISPSLDAIDVLSAMHLPFYVSPDMPGLGLKLQRAALEGLRSRGVDEVFMRAGVRGSGPRLGSMYRRLGAEEFGEMYRLPLQECA